MTVWPNSVATVFATLADVASSALVVESVYQMENLIKKANMYLSHETPRSQMGSLRVEGSEGGGPTTRPTPRPTPRLTP